MLKTLISRDDVIRLAFASTDYVPPTMLSQSDIAAAEFRYIIPVTGRKLYDKMLEGAYEELLAEYVASALALYTRYMVQPALNVATSAAGLSVAASSSADAADSAARMELQTSLRSRAHALLERLSQFLGDNAADYAEYDPREDVLKYCSTDGGFVALR